MQAQIPQGSQSPNLKDSAPHHGQAIAPVGQMSRAEYSYSQSEQRMNIWQDRYVGWWRFMNVLKCNMHAIQEIA